MSAFAAEALNADDVRFGELKVWVDANGNGITDAGELKTLAEVGIAGLRHSTYWECGPAVAKRDFLTSTEQRRGLAIRTGSFWYRDMDKAAIA
jgi:hypothetical protein